MRVILVDDERYSLTALEKVLATKENVEIVGSYTDPEKALADVEKTKPQLALLDIEMPGMNGLELGERLINIRPEIAIIYVTAYSEYALEAFEVSAIDYLLKPVNDKRLENALKRSETRILRDVISRKPALKREEGQVLKLKSFDGFEVYDSQGKAIPWRTQKAKELFIYLWLRDGDYAKRDFILEDVFPDKTPDKAGALLHTTVYQIRTGLRGAGFKNPIEFVNESYRLNVETESDAKQIRQMIDKGRIDEEDGKRLPRLCKGIFLEEAYPWVHKIKQDYMSKLFNVIDGYVGEKLNKQEASYDIEELAKLLLDIDYYSEIAAIHLINAYGMQKKKREMDLFYKSFISMLKEEMHESPGKDLEDAYLSYNS